jgi:CRP-like cAMP-binding protein
MESETARRNVLLNVLPEVELKVLLPKLQTIGISSGDELYAPGVDIAYVYFPLSGLCSLVARSRSGAVDVGPIGFDGMVGLPVYLEAPTGPLSATVHVSGTALRMEADAFHSSARDIPGFDRVLRRYVQWTYTGMGVWVACARLHELQERCARWLLMAHDRIRSERFPLTHDYLAQMLGVRRPSVSVAAGVLQQAGLIRYARGVVTIRDRLGLEQASCDCYASTTDEYERIFARSLRPVP